MKLFAGFCVVCKTALLSTVEVPHICAKHLHEIRAATAKGPDAARAVFARWERKYGYNDLEATRMGRRAP